LNKSKLAAAWCGFAGDMSTLEHKRYEENNMATGTVKWFNPTKGYGFIAPQDGTNDVFVHVSAVEKAGLRGLNEGQQVSYDLATERGKTSAANLQLVESDAA
jgi:CspA family cold shock protein